MSGVRNTNGISLDKMVKIFKKQVEKYGILGDLKKHVAFEKPSG